MELAVELNCDEINALQFPVVVEMWDHRTFGRVKRAYLREFPTKSERQRVAYYYKKFYRWYLIKGTPQTAFFKPEQLRFINRVVNFFGTA